MIRLTHLSGSLQGTVSASPKAVVRIGRGPDCDVRFDPHRDGRVSTRHAEIRFEGGGYVVIDTGSSNGTLVNGRRVRHTKLREGDRIVFGARGGPEVKFEIDGAFAAGIPARRDPTRAMASPSAGDDARLVARAAQAKISQARASSGGQSSGQTMFIVADSLRQVEEVTQRKDRRRTARLVAALSIAALLGFAALGAVIWDQRKQIEAIRDRKRTLDRQIQALQLRMQVEGDPDALAKLEEQLQALTGKARAAIGEMQRKDKAEAQKLEDQGDELDREIRRILAKFSAGTYVVPPLFKERLRFHIDATVRRSDTRDVLARKQRYWPMIVREFGGLGLPEEMAYVAWTESKFDPLAESAAAARGMWQFMAGTARTYGLKVAGGADERTDPQKSTRAAVRYLAALLADFGEDSFMLAMAAYNKGESGLRRTLRQIAEEPGGFRKEKRDFWHLYRLKKLPQETMEYVPQILAAAVICNNPKSYGLE